MPWKAGKLPRGYVSAMLIFGKRVASHGSDDMPVWGAKFRKTDPECDRSGQKHSLVAYLESIHSSQVIYDNAVWA